MHAVLPTIPPGEYRLQAYHGEMELAPYPRQPYYETTIKIPAGADTVKASVPFEPPPPYAPWPVVENGKLGGFPEK
jgi:hypothetical protein